MWTLARLALSLLVCCYGDEGDDMLNGADGANDACHGESGTDQAFNCEISSGLP